MAQPISAEQMFDAGLAFVEAKQWVNAVNAFEKAILLKPHYPTAFNQRGNVLQCMGQHFDAVLNYNMALLLDPTSPDLFNNRGAAFVGLGDYEGALKDYSKATELRNSFEQAWTNIGNVLKMVGRVEDARAAYSKAVEVNPNYADAHLNRSFVELELGNYDLGWEEYEWRWKSGQIPLRGLRMPTWNGEDLKGKSIILYGEQGLGDGLQFMRYATIVKEMGAERVILEVRPPLVRLAKTVSGVDIVIAHGDDIPPNIDYNCALMSLPRVLKTQVSTIPNTVPYVSCPNDAKEMWRQELAKYPGIKVGICWAGSPRPMQPASNAIDRRRSTALYQWAPLGGIPDVLFVSLQKEAAADQVQNTPTTMPLLDITQKLDDMTDTAALIANLDLVIAVDTAVVHLAGAMATPTWLLSRFDNCWRWLGTREDSPWYPTLRQFIQPKPGDWDSVFNQVGAELRRFVVEKSRIVTAA